MQRTQSDAEEKIVTFAVLCGLCGSAFWALVFLCTNYVEFIPPFQGILKETLFYFIHCNCSKEAVKAYFFDWQPSIDYPATFDQR